MIRRAKTILQSKDFTVLYDKGYHTGSQFEYVNTHQIEVIVAIPNVASHTPDHNYDLKHFTFDKVNYCYTYPQNQLLKTNGNQYNKGKGASIQKVRHYKTKACKTCPVYDKCTKSKNNGPVIE